MIIREAYRNMRRMPGNWAMMALTLAVAIGVGGVFTVLSVRAHHALREARESLSIQAFFDPSLGSDDASRIAESQIKSLHEVASYRFISKEQALDDYAKSSGENVESVLGMNPLPASVTIYLHEPSAAAATELAAKVKNIQGVQEIRSDASLLKTMEDRAERLDLITLIVAGLLILSAFFFVFTSSRLALAGRKDTLHAMALFGATRAMLAWPFIIEGALAGLTGGLLGALVLLAIQRSAPDVFSAGATQLSGQTEHVWLFLASIVVGIVLGVCGSAASMVGRSIEATE